ncbi:ankyrin repeat-containing domain protein [Amylostereum chailletii]|nr:ankyrin repeat-containing domain protein [Amylostereum chailletii]
MATPTPTPTSEDNDDALLSCRYGDLDDLRQYVDRFGAAALTDIHDDNRNTVLHMAAANGHTEILDFLLPIVPPSLLSTQNSSGSTALHWAALNSHLEVAQKLVEFPAGPGPDLIDIKNAAGRSPLGEAEIAGWEEGAKWMVGKMRLDDGGAGAGADAEGDAKEVVDAVEVEIEDADGQVAKMTLGGPSDEPRREPTPPTS